MKSNEAVKPATVQSNEQDDRQKKGGAVQALKDSLQTIRDSPLAQSRFTAELIGLVRQGREDAWNNLIPAFPSQSWSREAGAPGSPTSHMVTSDLLYGKEDMEMSLLNDTSSGKPQNGQARDDQNVREEQERGGRAR